MMDKHTEATIREVAGWLDDPDACAGRGNREEFAARLRSLLSLLPTRFEVIEYRHNGELRGYRIYDLVLFTVQAYSIPTLEAADRICAEYEEAHSDEPSI